MRPPCAAGPDSCSSATQSAQEKLAVFPVLDWILAITAHIPNKGEQLVRYYGLLQ
ncbi:MAG: hypothetical protein E6J54_04365 [Deltaproteobacteria bacterium]|nr:MAG: hypothetical protein E6J54_04365 [Deltaproteobacteria bacterium]